MTEAEALVWLASHCAADLEPKLTPDELDELLESARVADPAGAPPRRPWTAATSYPAGRYREPVTVNGHRYVVVVAGVSGATEPSWPTSSGAQVTDGSVVWAEAGTSWAQTWDLNEAAREGWLLKAGKCVGNHRLSGTTTVDEEGQPSAVVSSQPTAAECRRMAEEYAGSLVSTVLTGHLAEVSRRT